MAVPVASRGEVIMGEDESDDDNVPTFFDASSSKNKEAPPVDGAEGSSDGATKPAADWVNVERAEGQDEVTPEEDGVIVDGDIAAALRKKKKKLVVLPEATATTGSAAPASNAAAVVKRPPRRPISKKPKATVPLETEDEFGGTIPAPPPPDLDSAPRFREASAPDLAKEEEELQAKIQQAAAAHVDPNAMKTTELAARAVAAKDIVVKVSSSWFGEISKRFALQPTSAAPAPANSNAAAASPAAAPDAPPSDRSSLQDGVLPTNPQDLLAKRIKVLAKVSEKRAQDILSHYKASTYPLRCEQLRVPISVKLHHELVPPPAPTPIEDPPEVSGSPGPAAPTYVQPRTVRHPPVLAVAAYDLKRDWTNVALQATENAVHRELVVTERVGYQVMQTRANLAAFNDVMNAMRDAVVAMDHAVQPFFAPSSTLVVP